VFRPKERAAGRFSKSTLPDTFMTFGFSREEFGDLSIRQSRFQEPRFLFLGRGNFILPESQMSGEKFSHQIKRPPVFLFELEATQSPDPISARG
jgi:hypothetical protein